MFSTGVIVCDAASLPDQIADILLRLAQYVNGGGEFFSHVAFSSLASVAVSSRLRDFIIAPSGEGIKELKRDIEQEIDKVIRSAQIDDDLRDRLRDHYQHCKNDADDLLSQFKKDVAKVEKTCHMRCWVCFAIIFVLISVRISGHLGALNLLCLLPLLFARISMGSVYKAANSKLYTLRKNFNDVRSVCQSQYEQEQADTDASIQTKLAPKRRSSKRTTKR